MSFYVDTTLRYRLLSRHQNDQPDKHYQRLTQRTMKMLLNRYVEVEFELFNSNRPSPTGLDPDFHFNVSAYEHYKTCRRSKEKGFVETHEITSLGQESYGGRYVMDSLSIQTYSLVAQVVNGRLSGPYANSIIRSMFVEFFIGDRIPDWMHKYFPTIEDEHNRTLKWRAFKKNTPYWVEISTDDEIDSPTVRFPVLVVDTEVQPFDVIHLEDNGYSRGYLQDFLYEGNRPIVASFDDFNSHSQWDVALTSDNKQVREVALKIRDARDKRLVEVEKDYQQVSELRRRLHES